MMHHLTEAQLGFLICMTYVGGLLTGLYIGLSSRRHTRSHR